MEYFQFSQEEALEALGVDPRGASAGGRSSAAGQNTGKTSWKPPSAGGCCASFWASSKI